jgi:hypothetical protein
MYSSFGFLLAIKQSLLSPTVESETFTRNTLNPETEMGIYTARRNPNKNPWQQLLPIHIQNFITPYIGYCNYVDIRDSGHRLHYFLSHPEYFSKYDTFTGNLY